MQASSSQEIKRFEFTSVTISVNAGFWLFLIFSFSNNVLSQKHIHNVTAKPFISALFDTAKTPTASCVKPHLA